MKLQVTLVKSPVSSKPNHIKIVKALGLHKIRSTKVFEDTPSIRGMIFNCLLYTSPSPRDQVLSRMPSAA